MRARLLILLLAFTAPAAAQFTTVTGTVTDPNGIPYAFGTISATLVFSGGAPTLGGGSYQPPTQPTGLDAGGNFTMRLGDNGILSPGGSQWNFKVCSAVGTVQPAGGKGPICFTLAAPITITGATQSISANLNAVAPALTFTSGGGGSGTVSPNNGVVNAIATYAAAGGSTTVAPAAGGVACLPGATSGSACFTAPAVAGTTTNAVASSNTISFPNNATGITFPGGSMQLVGTGVGAGLFGGQGDALLLAAAPTIAAGGCGGSAASIVQHNGPGAFKVNVGTAPTSACTITLPSANTGYSCSVTDITTQSTSVFLQKVTSAESQTSITFTNFNTAGTATAFVANDIVKLSCLAD